MLPLNIRTELRTIFRNYWLAAITVLLLSLCLYAGWNGHNHVVQRVENIESAKRTMQEADALAIARLDSIEQGLEIGLATWQYPNSPTTTGNFNPRVAAFEPGNLSLIATGQSDMFNHYVKPTLTGDSFSIAFTELTSPVSLLMGNFDPAFVIVYLLPLLIISFCYNILSSEKEQGSLVLIASSPLSLRGWLLQKILIRFVVVAVLLSICLVLMLLLNGASLDGSTINLFVVVWLYTAFWFALAYMVNLQGMSSSRNAITMLGLWVALVLAIPSLIGQSANAIYPVPARTLLINEMRMAQNEIDKEQDAILDDYLRNHPELMTRDADESTAYGWWQRYFASKDLLAERMSPLVNGHDESLRKQQKWVNQLSFLSPAVLMQNSLNHMAETSTQHYDTYRQEVLTFSEEWRDFFLPMVFQDQPFTKDKFSQMPEFSFDGDGLSSPVNINSIILLLITVGLVVSGFARSGSKEAERLMQ